MYFFIAALIIGGTGILARKMLKQGLVKHFVVHQLELYFRLRKTADCEPQEAVLDMIRARYAQPSAHRSLWHVLQLWEEQLTQMSGQEKNDEEILLREFLQIVGLVENAEFSKLREPVRQLTFSKYYHHVAQRHAHQAQQQAA